MEAHEDEDLRRKRQEAANRRYAKSALALLLPIIYCILDAAGTFADSRVLDKLSARALAEGMFATADECSDYAASAANCAYELTFLLAGIVCFVYVVLIRRQKLIARQEAPKYAGAAFETAGQFAYIFALSDTAHVAISAPIISAYCVASVVWSRIFLKEKLSLKHYLMIALVVAGIVILAYTTPEQKSPPVMQCMTGGTIHLRQNHMPVITVMTLNSSEFRVFFIARPSSISRSMI